MTEVGPSRFVTLETPGHTPESMSYPVHVGDAGDKCWGMFTGGASFVGATARMDAPDPERTGENAGILKRGGFHMLGAISAWEELAFPLERSGSAKTTA